MVWPGFPNWVWDLVNTKKSKSDSGKTAQSSYPVAGNLCDSSRIPGNSDGSRLDQVSLGGAVALKY